jgi:hypothetical protein
MIQSLSKDSTHNSLFTMYSPYRGRCHTKKQNNFKKKITATERKKRKEQKKLLLLFPSLPFHWLIRKNKSIYQHCINNPKNSTR